MDMVLENASLYFPLYCVTIVLLSCLHYQSHSCWSGSHWWVYHLPSWSHAQGNINITKVQTFFTLLSLHKEHSSVFNIDLWEREKKKFIKLSNLHLWSTQRQSVVTVLKWKHKAHHIRPLTSVSTFLLSAISSVNCVLFCPIHEEVSTGEWRTNGCIKQQ